MNTNHIGQPFRRWDGDWTGGGCQPYGWFTGEGGSKPITVLPVHLTTKITDVWAGGESVVCGQVTQI